ncbi:serine hydrolase family protein [Limosilactobacillus sp. STM2_1]|uniref:Serine hydrolase family protein n=1 Tax=Limosilactobacillus rudii TaxID=2759755 RepID=A0A7W3UN45_9LACO|nr:alpha/beta hydrolase [Limosilactobacillus rudii]MBB1079280.1 serine hydrolase family protein [Limosilactobacillus rudii]MBB1098526.1 serine hydrolase family protein [Limosilactobacillus rudii]MCD7135535.1 alpha/beta hydrolase [Limosilactobacillus rudii]
MTKAYLIHGTSTRDDDWFPWLEEAAKPLIDIDRLWLPNPDWPIQSEWNQAVDKQISPHNGLILIAHSLGCITALRYIEQHQINDARLLLVGAFDKSLPAYPQLDKFMVPAPKYQQILPKISKATIITAKDDPIAPYKNSIDIAKKIRANLIVQDHGGHFLSSDGFTTFPLALRELTKIAI